MKKSYRCGVANRIALLQAIRDAPHNPKISEICRIANISHHPAMTHLTPMIEKGIVETVDKAYRTYKITPLGMETLLELERMNELCISNLGLRLV